MYRLPLKGHAHCPIPVSKRARGTGARSAWEPKRHDSQFVFLPKLGPKPLHVAQCRRRHLTARHVSRVDGKLMASVHFMRNDNVLMDAVIQQRYK